MRFTKAHGTGNDFVVLVDWEGALELTDTLVRALCDRRFGVGADGVIRILRDDDSDAFMDYRNADGSVVEMCGNGIRVVTKHVLDHDLVQASDGALAIGTRAGVKRVVAERGRDGRVERVTVGMGPARWHPSDIPFDAEGDEAVAVSVDVDGTTVELTAVGMGNPHAVLVVDDVAAAPVLTLGPRLEVHERFPKRTNVEFVEVVDAGRARLRVWERGIGETAACGSGACATVAALHRLDLTGREVVLDVPGGTLDVRLTDDDLELTGPAVEVAHGRLDAQWLAAARDGRFGPDERALT